MGDAKIKRLAGLALSAGQVINVDKERASQAVKQVVSAITDYHGADCLLYAHIGAALLCSLGLDAKCVAGSAIWRVGSGDGDVISHARELHGAKFVQDGAVKAGVFHAWIEAPGLIIDFSTSTLRSKASQLDAADGGITQVDWCPDFLWHNTNAPSPSGALLREPKNVNAAPHGGVFNYTRHRDIEAEVLANSSEFKESMKHAVFGAQAAYAAIGRGETLQIIGLSEDGYQEEAPAPAPLIQVHPRQNG